MSQKNNKAASHAPKKKELTNCIKLRKPQDNCAKSQKSKKTCLREKQKRGGSRSNWLRLELGNYKEKT